MRIGTDIVEVERIARAISNDKSGFLRRVFTDKEIEKINFNEPDYARASGFWAAKESVVKAVGFGFRNGIRFHDIEVDHDEFGAPKINLSGKLKEIFQAQKQKKIVISISHCRTHAVASTIIY